MTVLKSEVIDKSEQIQTIWISFVLISNHRYLFFSTEWKICTWNEHHESGGKIFSLAEAING